MKRYDTYNDNLVALWDLHTYYEVVKLATDKGLDSYSQNNSGHICSRPPFPFWFDSGMIIEVHVTIAYCGSYSGNKEDVCLQSFNQCHSGIAACGEWTR